jgi:hypothetical protein
VLVTKAINVRLDADSERALRAVERLDGLSTSAAVRRALLEAEQRRFSDEAVREAARRINEDPNERRISDEWLELLGDDNWDDWPE